jgi:DNA-binding helix-hairpin-helix protein with protein kinase domain
MQLIRRSNAETIELHGSSSLGAGGEARVFVIGADKKTVAKVYRRPNEMQAAKLAVMVAAPPADPMAAQGHVSIAWPTDLLETSGPEPRVAGFLMPRAEGTRRIIDFYNPMTRRRECPLFSYLYQIRTARNLSAAVHAVHARGYVIGDVNESNILVTDTSLVTLVDTDSFQVRDPSTGAVYRCPVGKPEFTPPELQKETFKDIDRAPEHDRFGLAVLIFQMLMEGTHPFAGVYGGGGDPPSYAARIAAGHFPYGGRDVPYHPMPVAPPFGILPPALQAMFVECFESGHMDPGARPEAEDWVNALQEAENDLKICRRNDQHRYGKHMFSCPWCERSAKLGGRDPYPSKMAVLHGDHLRAPDLAQTALPSAAAPPSPPRTYVPPPDLPTPRPPQRAPAQFIPEPAPAPIVKPIPPPEPQGPRITTAVRQEPRPALNLGNWPLVGGVVFIAIALSLFSSAQSRKLEIERNLTMSRSILSEIKSEFDQLEALKPGASIETYTLSIEKKAEAVSILADGVLKLDKGNRDGSSSKEAAKNAILRIRADKEAFAAGADVAAVTKAIERYKNKALTDAQAQKIRDQLKAQCEAALAHTDKALGVDAKNRLALTEKVRALRLMGETVKAETAANDALLIYPNDPELQKLKNMIQGG